MSKSSTLCAMFLVCGVALTHVADAAMLYSASLKNGDYGDGFKVGTYLESVLSLGIQVARSGGDLATLGIVDSSTGVTFTTANDVINYSLGADGKGGSGRADFRTHGTVSVRFKADSAAFVSGEPFADNPGFDTSALANFGAGMSRLAGLDGEMNTADDKVELSWRTWHKSTTMPSQTGWYDHVDITNDEVVLDLDKWHHLGLTWGGTTNQFELWVDGVLMAFDNLPSYVSLPWGTSASAYNFALGEIHQRHIGNNSPRGVTFADLEIWDEYRSQGNTQPTVPEPSSLVIFASLGVMGLAAARRRRRIAQI